MSKQAKENKKEKVNCEVCNGQGLDPENQERSCPECNGSGVK